MPEDKNQLPLNPSFANELLNPTFISQVASRLFNEFPEAGTVPKYETDGQNLPSTVSGTLGEKASFAGQHISEAPESKSEIWKEAISHNANYPENDFLTDSGKITLLKQAPELDSLPQQHQEDLLAANPTQDYYFLSHVREEKPAPLGQHADKLTDQQSYASNKNGSYGLEEFIKRSRPTHLHPSESFSNENLADVVPFFRKLNSGLPTEDDINFSFLYGNTQTHISPSPVNPHAQPEKYLSDAPHIFPDGKCYAEEFYNKVKQDGTGLNLESVFQSFRQFQEFNPKGFSDAQINVFPSTKDNDSFGLPESLVKPLNFPSDIEEAGKQSLSPFKLPSTGFGHYYFLKEPNPVISKTDVFDVATIRKDFPVLHQEVHGKPLIWFDNAATTQKPLSVINAISRFYATDNSNIHRGAHTLAARSTDAYEGAREKVRQFIGAGSTSEIIFVRGTTEGINLVAQTWGRKFIQPGDEIILTILEHHANIVPWQMLAREKGAIIRVAPINDNGEILLEEYTKLLNPRTRFVSLTQVSNGLGTILPVKEMIQLAKRYNARVLVDGAQSVAHTPTNVQELDADFFVFSGHKIFAPTGIGVVYGKRELLEIIPPWQGGGNMIKDVTFGETLYNEPPDKFEAGTPSVADAVGLGAALDYVNKIGLENISRYEHLLTEYGMEKLSRIPGLRLIGTAKYKVAVLSFVLNNKSNEEVGKLLDQEGIAVRAGHHCTQPSLRRFGVEGTVRPSLAFYNTKEEIDRLADAIRRIQQR